MENLSSLLTATRKKLGLKIKEVSHRTGIDQALVSKYEHGHRIPSEKHVKLLAEHLSIDYPSLRAFWLAERIVHALQDEADPSMAWELAEPRVEYLRKKKTDTRPKVSIALQAKLDLADELREKWQATKPLDTLQLRKMNEYFDLQYTYHSNKIEGNTLTFQETTLVVEQGITIGGKSMREHLEAINHAEAVAYLATLVREKQDLTRRNLLDFHRLILKSDQPAHAGRYRSVQVHIGGSEHMPPEPYLLDKMMEDYFLTYQSIKHSVHPIILAADMHERLVTIHPFIDGNGRTSRLIMNLILLSAGFTICNLKGDLESRLKYYKALEHVQLENDTDPFYHLIADASIDSLRQHLKMI